MSLLTQLAGNVEPILNLTRDCVRPDPHQTEKVQIEWVKPRAGLTPESVQKVSFDRTGKYVAPRLIDDLQMLTHPLLPRVSASDQNSLFICGCARTKTYGPMPYNQIAWRVKPFLMKCAARIQAWNRENPRRQQKALLPEFELRDLRGSVATRAFLEYDGDIRRPQRLLNHKSPDTTEGYIKGPSTDDRNWRIFKWIQQSYMDHLCGQGATEDAPPQPAGRASASMYNDCRDPMLPSAGKPRLCPHFQKCTDCPNLLVPTGAEQFAKLLRVKEALEVARAEQDPARWNWLYSESYWTLNKVILPKFPEELEPEARAIAANLPPLPPLE